MNEIKFLRKLDSAASAPTPSIDVSDRVIRRIRNRIRLPQASRPWWLAAALSSAVAAAVVLFAVQEMSATQEPFNGLLSPLTTSMQ
jgi:hypothetical protein